MTDFQKQQTELDDLFLSQAPNEESKKLKMLEKKMAQLKEVMRKEKSKEEKKKRARDNRRKILIGAYIIEQMKRGKIEKDKILRGLDKFLTRNTDREIFELPPISTDESNSSDNQNVRQ
jgi:large subunit ribosomal protein L7/L12